jgi:hypothetical protein
MYFTGNGVSFTNCKMPEDICSNSSLDIVSAFSLMQLSHIAHALSAVALK